MNLSSYNTFLLLLSICHCEPEERGNLGGIATPTFDPRITASGLTSCPSSINLLNMRNVPSVSLTTTIFFGTVANFPPVDYFTGINTPDLLPRKTAYWICRVHDHRYPFHGKYGDTFHISPIKNAV
ncbi:hypothetical protein M1N41_02420 [Thermodesulfovibrionales bacterium]|nr:hypothetical protein [Thermodesulfovibrionales bacterium]